LGIKATLVATVFDLSKGEFTAVLIPKGIIFAVVARIVLWAYEDE
jgi:hypothetical protein